MASLSRRSARSISERPEQESGIRPSAQSGVRAACQPDGPAGAALARCDRIEHKVRVSKILLEDLPLGDARAKLLRTAIIRRDEVLLDGVLALLVESRGR